VAASPIQSSERNGFTTREPPFDVVIRRPFQMAVSDGEPSRHLRMRHAEFLSQ